MIRVVSVLLAIAALAVSGASARDPGVLETRWDPGPLAALPPSDRPVQLRSVPLPGHGEVDLEVHRFHVADSRTRFVVGRRGENDLDLDFDPATIALFRGRVVGHVRSHVYLAVGPEWATGHVDLGDGSHHYRFSQSEADERLSIFAADSPSEPPPGVPVCDLQDAAEDLPYPGATATAVVPALTPGLRQLELAVETDYEYFQLFGDLSEAASYLVAMYGEVSAIFMRDVDTRVDLSFVRLWDDPDDLFNIVDPSPLSDFRTHWNTFMDDVPRDAAQLFSGRRDYPFGGQAYLSTLCGGSGYSVVGYATGFFPDPSRPSRYHYDISVTAHELGHNAGTGHTHDNHIDTCNNTSGTPQRGTIMSYCGQTWSGGNGNRDLYFHSTIQANIEAHIANSSCVVADCNGNGVDDATDVAGASADLNTNGVPDECEDCNGNSVLDDQDIAGTTSTDLNLNGIPDECEPDCDGDGVPDDREIQLGTSIDEYGNDVPDECEVDCNDNGTSDYTEIQADMQLDVDRSAELDACQDCDGDLTPDHVELAGAHDLWVASGLSDQPVRRFYSVSGVLVGVTTGFVSTTGQAQGLIVTDDKRVLVSSASEDRVLEFDVDGNFVQVLVPFGIDAPVHPAGMVVTPDDRLLVSSNLTNSIKSYHVDSGAFLGDFVPPGAGGLAAPFGLTLGPGGNLFVSNGTDEVLEYHGQTGAFVGAFVSSAQNGGLDEPRGLTFKADGNLLVASFGSNEVLEYDGQDGAPLGKWAQVGTASVLTQVSPWGVRIGPNGNVFVGRTGEGFGSVPPSLATSEHDHHDETDIVIGELHLTNAQMYEYDVRNGNFIRSHISGNDHGLMFTTEFDFVPGWDVDCNYNQLQDDCDIVSGASQDVDANGIPDECEIDCNANGVQDRLDVIPFGSSIDCNFNLLPDDCDVASGASQDCDGNTVPDECEPDCNGNGVADACDIAAGTLDDCDASGVPDRCEATFDFEAAQGWSVGAAGDGASDGLWVRVNPVGTDALTEFDHTADSGDTCYVTGQGVVGGSNGADDVDGGATSLVSPLLDLSSDPDPQIGYWRWFSNDAGSNPSQDVFRVEVSDNAGTDWTVVETVGPSGSQNSGGWFYNRFRVADFVTPGPDVRLRFVAEDASPGSVVEAAVDDVLVLADCCELPGEVGGLLLDHDGDVQLSWSGPGAGEVWDVAGGLVSELAVDGSVASATCLADDLGTENWEDTRPGPSVGGAFYYLVRSQRSCGSGTYGFASSGAERQPADPCP